MDLWVLRLQLLVLTLGCNLQWAPKGPRLKWLLKWTNPPKPLPTSPHPAKTIVELLWMTVLIQTNPTVATLVPNHQWWIFHGHLLEYMSNIIMFIIYKWTIYAIAMLNNQRVNQKWCSWPEKIRQASSFCNSAPCEGASATSASSRIVAQRLLT